VRRAIALILVMGTATAALAGDAITQADLLRRLIWFDWLTEPPAAGEASGLFSSADRETALEPTGRLLAGKTDRDAGHFLRRGADGWNVMGAIDGPGALVRIWSADGRGQLRITLDGETVIDAALADLFNGVVAPFGRPLAYCVTEDAGCVSYFPIGFARRCEILGKGVEGAYQVDYVRFGEDAQVQRFTTEPDGAAQEALTEVVAAMTEGLRETRLLTGRNMTAVAGQQDLKRGEKLTLSVDRPGTIRSLMVSLTDRNAPRDVYSLRYLLLRMYWDGQARPSVEAPLADFFGSGFDRRQCDGLPIGNNLFTDLPGQFLSESWQMYCYFPMPFSSSARLEIENLNRRTIGLMATLQVDRAEPREDALRFKARYRQERPCKGVEYTVLESGGPGRLVGCVLNADCPRRGWWGEGDHKIWIDGQKFPGLLGTGIADYFGDVAPLHLEGFALAGVTRMGAYGKSSAYRWQMTDSVAFHKSIRFVFETVQPGDSRDVDFSSVAYWYAAAASGDSFKPVKLDDLTPAGLRIPASFEVEGHLVGENWGNALKQASEPGVEFSGEAAASIATDQPLQAQILAPKAGKYRLGLRLHPGRPFERIEVSANTGAIGTIEYRRIADGVYDVGEVELKFGENLLTVKCSKRAVLDCWILTPVGE
jgi:hypothetical protein